MVKQYGQLYLDTRHALLETEDAQTAGDDGAAVAVPVFPGKVRKPFWQTVTCMRPSRLCRDMSRAVRRLLDGEPLAYVLGGVGAFTACPFG